MGCNQYVLVSASSHTVLCEVQQPWLDNQRPQKYLLSLAGKHLVLASSG